MRSAARDAIHVGHETSGAARHIMSGQGGPGAPGYEELTLLRRMGIRRCGERPGGGRLSHSVIATGVGDGQYRRGPINSWFSAVVRCGGHAQF